MGVAEQLVGATMWLADVAELLACVTIHFMVYAMVIVNPNSSEKVKFYKMTAYNV